MICCALVPLNVTVFEPEVKVPEFVQLPETSMSLESASSSAPRFILILPLISSVSCKVHEAEDSRSTSPVNVAVLAMSIRAFMSILVLAILTAPVRVTSPSSEVVPEPEDCVTLAAFTVEEKVTSEAEVIVIEPSAAPEPGVS